MNRDEIISLLEEIKDPEYRRALVEGHAKDTIAFQIRQLRKAEGWEQRDLAEKLGNPKLQPMISRYENPDYGRYSITTLLQLAAAFDVALVVRFAPYSELLEWDLNATNQVLAPASYRNDAGLVALAGQAHQHRCSMPRMDTANTAGNPNSARVSGNNDDNQLQRERAVA